MMSYINFNPKIEKEKENKMKMKRKVEKEIK